MSGGHLVVLDQAGREVKQFDLPSGLATLGRDPPCDIRIMLRNVQPHHATVVVHSNQAVVRNVGSGETLLNGVSISVAALRQDDVLSVGGRQLRWRYAHPAPHHARRRPDSPVHSALVGARSGKSGRSGRGRHSEGARLQNMHHTHRDSAPASMSTRQVAIVQPQRRDTANHIESVSSSAISVVTNVRRRGTIKSDSDMDTSLNKSIEDHNKSKSPKNTPINLQNTTKATLWIESRKTSPRKSLQEIPTRAAITPKRCFSAKKSTPLRMAVLKKAQSAQKTRVSKIQAPLTIDHTKQAAIMLMAGHTPKLKGLSPIDSQQGGSARKSTLLVGIKTPRPRGRPPKKSLSASTRTARTNTTSDINSTKGSLDQSASVMEITDSDTQQSTMRESDASRPYSSPRKSALRDPSAKRSSRKAESIKFDLSNLGEEASLSALSLRYSESPSSPRATQSRARDILCRSLGDSASSPKRKATTTPTPSLRSPRLNRGSLMLRRALHTTSPEESYSIVDLVSVDSSSLYGSASNASPYESPNPDRSSRAMRTRSLLASSTPAIHRARSRSAITSQSYDTIHDNSQSTIFSESNRRSKSLSMPVEASINGTYNVSGKKGKSQSPLNLEKVQGDVTFNIARKSRQSRRTPDNSKENFTVNRTSPTTENTTATFNVSRKSIRTRSTLELENSPDNMTLNSTRPVSLFSQNRSRLTEVDMVSARESLSKSASPKNDGASTPKNQRSPEEAGTPMLSIQSLLDSTQNSTLPQQSMKKVVTRMVTRRKTIGSRLSIPTNRRNVKSKSLSWSTRPSLRTRKSKSSPADSDISLDVSLDDGDTTPKSAVKLVQEAVKNKHSTAKKPKSKRSIIDNLNDSDIVKQLFNSPVKRKLSQSMIEFSRRHSEEDLVFAKRSTRNTISLTGKSPENSILVQSQAFTPEIFVSPLSTPSNSPNVVGIKRLFAKNTPENDLRNVRGVKKLMQTPPLRRSIRNDLTQVSGVKSVFGRSPRNRLSDVRIKEIFANSPKNDLRRVSGVKTLFQPQKKNKSPKNDLRDVANVRNLYKKNSPRNDLSNVSGVKRVMRQNSPKNNLTDVRGLRTLFHLEKNRDDLNNISGIEELFSESHQTSNMTDANSESSFNLLVGKPAVRAYPKAKSFITNSIQKPKLRRAKSLQTSFSLISNNVEDWLENELRKRMHKEDDKTPSSRKSLRKNNQENMSISTSKANRSSSVISRGNMSRSRNVSAVSKFGISGRKSAKNNSDTILQRSKSKLEASNTSINKSVTSVSRNNISQSKNKTAIYNSDIIDAGDEIPKGNRTNKSMSNEGTPTKTLKSQNKTASNKSDIIVGNDETSKGINSKVSSSNTSVARSKTYSEETPRKTSKNKTNRSRELLKLATDTVEGNTPVLTTRVRNSTLIKTSSVESAERKKSTSEIYGEHTLPIKKRSLVDTSGNRNREKSVLPIKKRAVVHSTPVKGRINMTLNASEIGRVSPIAPLLQEVAYDRDANPTTRITEEPKNSLKRKQIQTSDSKTLAVADANKESVSPPPVRATRRRKTRQSLGVNNVKKRKSSIVITNKTPGFSPKLSKNVATEVPHVAENTQPLVRKTRGRILTRENSQVDTGKEKPVNKNVRKNTLEIKNQKSDSINQKKKPGRKTNIRKSQGDSNKKTSTLDLPSEEIALNPRKTRGQKMAVVKIQTPKKLTRSKASKTGVVITKPSPQIKPGTKNQGKKNETENSSKTKMPRTRNAKAHDSKTNESEPKDNAPIKNTRNIKKAQTTTDSNANNSNIEVELNVKSKRGRKTIAQSNAEVESKETEVKTRSTRNVGQQQTAKETSRTKLRKLASQEAGKKVADSENMDSGPSENISRRRKRTCTIEKSPSQAKKRKIEDDVSRRIRGNKIKTESSKSKQQNMRGRTERDLNNVQSSQDKEPAKESKSRRGAKSAEVESLQTGNSHGAAKTRGSNKTREDIQPVRNVRGRKTQTVEANKTKSPEAKTEEKRRTRRGDGDGALKSINGAKRKPGQAEEKTTRRQKISEIPKTEVKTTRQQKISKILTTEVKTTRRQKATEPEKPLAGRKRKNNADGSTVKEAAKPSKAPKTSAVSPKAKRGRGSKAEEPRQPAARSRRT